MSKGLIVEVRGAQSPCRTSCRGHIALDTSHGPRWHILIAAVQGAASISLHPPSPPRSSPQHLVIPFTFHAALITGSQGIWEKYFLPEPQIPSPCSLIFVYHTGTDGCACETRNGRLLFLFFFLGWLLFRTKLMDEHMERWNHVLIFSYEDINKHLKDTWKTYCIKLWHFLPWM